MNTPTHFELIPFAWLDPRNLTRAALAAHLLHLRRRFGAKAARDCLDGIENRGWYPVRIVELAS